MVTGAETITNRCGALAEALATTPLTADTISAVHRQGVCERGCQASRAQLTDRAEAGNDGAGMKREVTLGLLVQDDDCGIGKAGIQLHPQQRGQASVEPLVEIALGRDDHVVPVVPDKHGIAGVRDVVVNDANVDL